VSTGHCDSGILNCHTGLWVNNLSSTIAGGWIMDETAGGAGWSNGISIRNIASGGVALAIPDNIPVVSANAAGTGYDEMMFADTSDHLYIGYGMTAGVIVPVTLNAQGWLTVNGATPIAGSDGELWVSGDQIFTGSTGEISTNAYYNGGWKYIGNASAEQIAFNSNGISFYTGAINASGAGAALTQVYGLNVSLTGVVTAEQTTASTSTATGALVDDGGLGVAGAGYFGGKLSAGSHILAASTTPTISACGTGSPAVAGSDNFGKISTGGGTLTSCVINFGVAWTTAPACSVSFSASTLAVTVATSTTQLTVGATSLTSETIFYTCGSVSQLDPANDNFATMKTAA
jgi:hypothetical protein